MPCYNKEGFGLTANKKCSAQQCSVLRFESLHQRHERENVKEHVEEAEMDEGICV